MENQSNQSNQNNQQWTEQSVRLLFQNTYLKEIDKHLFQNDDDSKRFHQEIDKGLFNFLSYTISNINLEIAKEIIYYLVFVLKKRSLVLESLNKQDFATLLKFLTNSHNIYMNVNPQLNTINESKLIDMYNEDYYYLTSTIKNEETSPNFFNNLIEIDNKKMFPLTNCLYPYFLKLLYHHTGFFESLAQYLSIPLIDFEIFSYTLFCYCNQIQNYINFSKELKLKLAETFVNYITNIEESSIKEITKNYYEGLLINISFIHITLIGDCIKEIDNDECFEKIKPIFYADLRLIKVNLNSSILEKRIMALKCLVDEVLQKNLQYEKLLVDSVDSKQKQEYAFIRKRYILKWFEETDFFNIIFGENMHEAIVKKSSLVMVFLYINDCLPFERILYIWKLAQDRHEALTAAILSIFSDLISSLSIDHAIHILKEINDSPFKEITDVTLKILDSFSNNKFLVVNEAKPIKVSENLNEFYNNLKPNNIENKGPQIDGQFAQQENNLNIMEVLNAEIKGDAKDIQMFKSFYLKILWKFSSEKSFYKGLSPLIINKARNIFAKNLVKPVFKYDFAKYMKKFIINIKTNHYLTTNLVIFEKIIKNIKNTSQIASQNHILVNTLNIFGPEIKDHRSLILYLDKQYNLLSIILNSTLNLKKEALSLTDEIQNISSSSIIDNLNQGSILEFLNRSKNQMLIEESKESNGIGLRNEGKIQINRRLSEEEFKIEEIGGIENQVAIGNNINNLDDTVSTSMDRTISTISTVDVSSDDLPHVFILKTFFDKAQAQKINYEQHDHILKKLSLNFSNHNYNSILVSIMEITKFIIFNSDVKLQQKQIEFLFEVLVDNSVEEEEVSVFYQFLTEILKYQNLGGNFYLSEEILQFIFFDLILKSDLASLSYQAFMLFKQMFFYMNKNLGVLKTRTQNLYDISDFTLLIGFESLWKIYLESESLIISKESQELIVNLINSISRGNDSNQASILYIFQKTFDSLHANYEEIKDDIELKYDKIEQTKKLINLLFIVNNNKQRFEKFHENEILTVKMTDGNMSTHTFTLSSDTTLKEVREMLIKKLNMDTGDNYSHYYMLLYKGKILSNEKHTLRDIKFENNGKLMYSKTDSMMLDFPVEIEESRIQELITNMKFIFETLDPEVIRLALKKNNYSDEQTVYYLADDGNVQQLICELAELNQLNKGGIDNPIRIDIFTSERLELLFRLLSLNSLSITSSIWQLLSAVKFNDNYLSNLIDTASLDFKQIFNFKEPNKLLLNIRIINTLIFKDNYFINLTKLEEIKINEWKINFLISDGINSILSSINYFVTLLEEIEPKTQITLILQILQILTKWLHYFTFSSTVSLATTKDYLSNIIKMIIQQRPPGVNASLANPGTTSKDSTPSYATPTFGSNNNSFSDVQKPQIKKALITGAEEYDSTYDEEVVNTFFEKLIHSNFHLSVLKFSKFASSEFIVEFFWKENETIYLNLIEILIVMTEMNSEVFQEVIEIETEKSQLMNILFVEKSKFVRKIVENLFILLSQIKFDFTKIERGLLKEKNIKSVKELIMQLILKNYKSKIYSDQVHEEYFNLFGHFLATEKDFQENFEDFSLNELTSQILQNIFDLSDKKDQESFEIQQEQLSGNIYLLQCLCFNNENVVLNSLEEFSMKNNKDIVQFFYSKLFGIDNLNEDTDYSKLRFVYSNRNLRQKAYNLLIAIVKLKESYKFYLGERLMTHHKGFFNTNLNLNDLDINVRGMKDKFVGLRNYGCTCYMNSLLQQLFMIKEFRCRLLEIPLNELNKVELENNPVYNLQLLFANLLQTLKQYHTPMHFINSLKGFGGDPINVRVQQDCDEFLNLLIDRLESILKETEYEKIFDNSIRGKLASEIISTDKEYPYYSETIESNMTLSLDIKNKRNIEEALDLYVKGENLEFNIEKYNKKINVLKRISIKKLSEVVFIHLKRFEFDFNTFERIKVNDYCEFPMNIDFRPWMWSTIISQNKEDPNFKDIVLDDIEMNEPDAFKYQLAGVVVHSGGTESGHYYSFIHSEDTGKWYRFDDSTVTEFNINDLKAECFGNEEKESNNEVFMRSKNAYLLLYRKVNSNNENKKNFNENVSPHLMNQIQLENRLFLTYKTYIDNDYYSFVKDYLEIFIKSTKMTNIVIKKEKSMSRRERVLEDTFQIVTKKGFKDSTQIQDPIQMKELIDSSEREAIQSISRENRELNHNNEFKKNIVKFATYYFFEILLKNKDTHKINNFSNTLIELFSISNEQVIWFIKKFIAQPQMFLTFILYENSVEIRENFSKIINSCIQSLYFIEEKFIDDTFTYIKYYLDEEINEEGEKLQKLRFETIQENKSALKRFYEKCVLSNIDVCRQNWQKFSQFFFILNCCCNYSELCEQALKKDAYFTILKFIMNNEYPFQSNLQKMRINNAEPNFNSAIEFLANLVTSCVHAGVYNLHKYSVYSKFQEKRLTVELPEKWNILFEKNVLFNTILRRYCNDSTKKIIHHLSWGEESNTKIIIEGIMSTLKENIRDIRSVNDLIGNLVGLIEIEDNHKALRVKMIFALDDFSENESDSIFNFLLSFRDEMALNTIYALKCFGDHIIKFNHVFQYVSHFIAKFEWIYYFLRDIKADVSKKDILNVEASSDGINFGDLLNQTTEIYYDRLNLFNLYEKSKNMQIDSQANDDEINEKKQKSMNDEPYP